MALLNEKDFHNILSIGVALGTEKSLSKLLKIILDKGKAILKCQMASFFFVDSSNSLSSKQLVYFNDQTDIQNKNVLQDQSFPIDNYSLAGYVANHKCLLNLESVHELDSHIPFTFNPNYDQRGPYPCQSMLSAPLVDSENKLIGVLQFFNKLNDLNQIDAFNTKDEFILKSLSSQASVAIIGAKSNEDIKNLFEGFIRASVTAIESRDPTTSGHSERVAKITLALSQEVHDLDHGQFKGIHFNHNQFRQIEFAALLHDFGKIGVREHILSKANKLYPHELPDIFSKLDLICKDYALNIAQKKISYLLQHKQQDTQLFFQLDKQHSEMIHHVEHLKDMLRKINLPGKRPLVVMDSIYKLVEKIQHMDQEQREIISQSQYDRLSIQSGTLTPTERQQIQEHVTNSFLFLQKIPWTRSFARVPEIAFSHHEKIDGSGYPRGLKGQNIPIESRIMTVADIYDALVSLDRPYKKAIPTQDAIHILKEEALAQKIEIELVNIFIQKKLYSITK